MKTDPLTCENGVVESGRNERAAEEMDWIEPPKHDGCGGGCLLRVGGSGGGDTPGAMPQRAFQPPARTVSGAPAGDAGGSSSWRSDSAPESKDRVEGGGDVIRGLGELGAGAVVSVHALARMFGKHPESVRRAVRRGELPPPIRLFGHDQWTVGYLVGFLDRRQEEAETEKAHLKQTTERLGV